MSESVLEIKNVSKYYGKNKVVDNVSFSVEKGQILGFLGPNGAGKTTTIKMILGLLSIDEGSIKVNGFDVKKNFEKAMEYIGGIVENPDMYGYMSAVDNLKLFAKIRNINYSEVYKVLELVGLKKSMNQKVSKYSLGMKQRLALSIALLSSPQFLMLDEPMNGLDPSGVFELRKELRKMVDEYGMSLLISSHQLNEIEKIADRIIYIENGKIKEVEKQEQTITYQIRVNKIITDHRFRKLSDFLYEFSIQNPNELSVYLRKLEREGVQLLDITNTSDDLENMYTRIYGE